MCQVSTNLDNTGFNKYADKLDNVIVRLAQQSSGKDPFHAFAFGVPDINSIMNLKMQGGRYNPGGTFMDESGNMPNTPVQFVSYNGNAVHDAAAMKQNLNNWNQTMRIQGYNEQQMKQWYPWIQNQLNQRALQAQQQARSAQPQQVSNGQIL